MKNIISLLLCLLLFCGCSHKLKREKLFITDFNKGSYKMYNIPTNPYFYFATDSVDNMYLIKMRGFSATKIAYIEKLDRVKLPNTK